MRFLSDEEFLIRFSLFLLTSSLSLVLFVSESFLSFILPVCQFCFVACAFDVLFRRKDNKRDCCYAKVLKCYLCLFYFSGNVTASNLHLDLWSTLSWFTNTMRYKVIFKSSLYEQTIFLYRLLKILFFLQCLFLAILLKISRSYTCVLMRSLFHSVYACVCITVRCVFCSSSFYCVLKCTIIMPIGLCFYFM